VVHRRGQRKLARCGAPASAPDEGGQPVATPADSEAAQEPAPAITERLSYLDAGGRLVPREAAQFAVIRDFDDDGNVISFMTERL
jgi:hypothetical protein